MLTPEHHVALVDRLVQQTQPIRRLWPVRARMAVFVVLAGAIVAAVAASWSRPDFGAKLAESSFTFGFGTLLVATTYTAWLALRSAVPGRSPSRAEGVAALALLVGAALFSCAEPADTATALGTFLGVGWACAARTFAFAVLPWTLLTLAIRRGAPTHVPLAGAYAGATAMLLSTAILRTACPQDGPLHWLIWHFAPIPIGTALSAAIASRWLTWRHV